MDRATFGLQDHICPYSEGVGSLTAVDRGWLLPSRKRGSWSWSVESKSVCMYVCMFVKCLVIGLRVKVCVRNPGTMCNTRSIKHFTHFVAVLIWRDTDEMPQKSSRDRRWQGDRERRMVVCQCSRRHAYVDPSVWGWIPVACSRNWGTQV